MDAYIIIIVIPILQSISAELITIEFSRIEMSSLTMEKVS